MKKKLLLRGISWFLSVAVIVALTTMPWSNYVGHSHWDKVHWVPFYHPVAVLDVVGNVALFFPFGYYFPQALRGRSRGTRWGVPVLLAIMLSTAVELFQVYSHSRIPSMTDICTNVLGATLGLLVSR